MQRTLTPHPCSSDPSLGLDAYELEAAIAAVDDKLDAATRDDRRLLLPVRAALLRALAYQLTP